MVGWAHQTPVLIHGGKMALRLQRTNVLHNFIDCPNNILSDIHVSEEPVLDRPDGGVVPGVLGIRVMTICSRVDIPATESLQILRAQVLTIAQRHLVYQCGVTRSHRDAFGRQGFEKRIPVDTFQFFGFVPNAVAQVTASRDALVQGEGV